MLRIKKQLALGLILVLPLSFAAGCASGDYRASSKIKWDYYAPADPWPNQKLGICCFVYEDPPDEQTVIARSEPRPSSREVQETTAAQSSLEAEKAKLATQLNAAQAELAAKDRENQTLASRLEAAQAELSAKARLEKENAESAAQLQAAKRELAARSAQDEEKAELARQLESARRETEKLKAAQADLALRLGQDNEKADLARQLQEARAALRAQSAEESQAAELGKQLEAARAELAAKGALEKEKEDLARKLEDSRAALSQKSAREAELDKAVKSMEQALEAEIAQKTGTVRRGEGSFTLELADQILYESGSERISPQGLKVLKRVAGSLKEGGDKIIRVEGHTDDVPIRKSPPPRFRSNWELSAARAGNVVQYLHEKEGLKPTTLSAAGYGPTRPAVPNEDDATRARNRRVEIIIQPVTQSTSVTAPRQ